MILEVATLTLRTDDPATCADFEATFRQAAPLIAGSPGCRSHRLERCLETPGRYLLLVEWETLEDHTVGFRGSPAYGEWRTLLHSFYDPFPTVEHFIQVDLAETG